MYKLLSLLYLQFELHSKFRFIFIASFSYRTLNKLKLISSPRRIAQTQSFYLLWRVNSSKENTVIENVHQLKVLMEFSGFLIYFIRNPLSRVFAEISFEFNFIFSRISHPRVFIIFRIPIRRCRVFKPDYKVYSQPTISIKLNPVHAKLCLLGLLVVVQSN